MVRKTSPTCYCNGAVYADSATIMALHRLTTVHRKGNNPSFTLCLIQLGFFKPFTGVNMSLDCTMVNTFAGTRHPRTNKWTYIEDENGNRKKTFNIRLGNVSIDDEFPEIITAKAMADASAQLDGSLKIVDGVDYRLRPDSQSELKDAGVKSATYSPLPKKVKLSVVKPKA